MVQRVEGLTYLVINIGNAGLADARCHKMAFIVKGRINEEHNVVYLLNSDVAFTH